MMIAINLTDSVSFKQGLKSAEDSSAGYTVTNSITVHLADHYDGNLLYVSPYTSITYEVRQTAPDITVALRLAIQEAVNRVGTTGKIATVRIPPGLFTLSDTIVRPNNIVIEGCGSGIDNGATHFRRILDYGNTFAANYNNNAPGSFISGGGYRNFRLYVDHGGENMWGYFNPTADVFINKVTTGAHFVEIFPKDTHYENLYIVGMTRGFVLTGGVNFHFRNIDVLGIWDLLSSARQEMQEAISIDGDLTNGIPTSWSMTNVNIGGDKVAATVTYPGSSSFTQNTVLNQGPLRGLVISCSEEFRVSGLYIQGAASADLVFHGKPNAILQGGKFSNCGFDPCGVTYGDAFIKFEDEGITSATPTALSFSSCQILGQGNGYIGISDRGSTPGRVSVCGLTWDGEISTLVSNAVRLEHAAHIHIAGSIRAFNNQGFYNDDGSCGVYIGANTYSWLVSAVLGGTSGGNTTGHFCIDGVQSANAASANGKVLSVNGGLLGSLYVANGKIMDRILDDGSIAILGANDYTYDIKISAKKLIFNGALTKDITVTLPTTNIPDGWSFYAQRAISASGAYNINISGISLTNVNTYIVFTYYNTVGWIVMGRGSLV